MERPGSETRRPPGLLCRHVAVSAGRAGRKREAKGRSGTPSCPVFPDGFISGSDVDRQKSASRFWVTQTERTHYSGLISAWSLRLVPPLRVVLPFLTLCLQAVSSVPMPPHLCVTY